MRKWVSPCLVPLVWRLTASNSHRTPMSFVLTGYTRRSASMRLHLKPAKVHRRALFGVILGLDAPRFPPAHLHIGRHLSIKLKSSHTNEHVSVTCSTHCDICIKDGAGCLMKCREVRGGVHKHHWASLRFLGNSCRREYWNTDKAMMTPNQCEINHAAVRRLKITTWFCCICISPLWRMTTVSLLKPHQ